MKSKSKKSKPKIKPKPASLLKTVLNSVLKATPIKTRGSTAIFTVFSTVVSMVISTSANASLPISPPLSMSLPLGTATVATTMDVMLLAMFVFMAVGVSFACSLAESTLLSLTPSYIADLKESDPEKSELLKSLKQDKVDQSLAAILTLNTMANTLGSIGAGAQANIVFGNAWFGVFSGVMTLAILTFSEIIPKTLGTVYWRQLSGIVAFSVRGMILILFPIIWLSEKLTNLLVKGKDNNDFNRREFAALASVGEESGEIDPLESRIIRNLLAFGVIKVEDIMTPRSVILSLEQSETVAEVFANRAKLSFSRLPIYDEELDKVTGFVLKTDLLLAKSENQLNQSISNYKREMSFVFSKMKLFDLLDMMLKDRVHIAMAVGEFGEVKGLVTLEDVLETLLGLEIVDEIDNVEDMQELARQLMDKRVKRLGMKVQDNESASKSTAKANSVNDNIVVEKPYLGESKG